jgi:hypothetical protein
VVWFANSARGLRLGRMVLPAAVPGRHEAVEWLQVSQTLHEPAEPKVKQSSSAARWESGVDQHPCVKRGGRFTSNFMNAVLSMSRQAHSSGQTWAGATEAPWMPCRRIASATKPSAFISSTKRRSNPAAGLPRPLGKPMAC